MYIDLKVDLLFIAFLIGILISLLAKFDNVLIISSCVVIIYIILVFIDNNNTLNTRNTRNIIKKKGRIINSDNVVNINNKKIKENYGSSYKKSNGLFDGLLPKQLVNRFNYLYEITKNPYKSSKSYSKYIYNKNNNNERVPYSAKHIEIAEKYYPQLSSDAVNMTDCMIYDSNNPSSCNQGNDKWKAEDSIMSQLKINEEQLNQIIREDFKPPNSLLESNLQIKQLLK